VASEKELIACRTQRKELAKFQPEIQGMQTARNELLMTSFNFLERGRTALADSRVAVVFADALGVVPAAFAFPA
jgi:hypothetical protein